MKRRILNYGNFLLESTKYSPINEQTQLDSIPSSELEKLIDVDLKSFLKKVMWNKSVQVFYGKDYQGNPIEDKREVYTGAWFSGHDKATMGEFFQDAWAETDQFCNRVAEMVEKGEISDTWGTIGTGALWALGGAVAAAATVATGGAIWGVIQGIGAGGGLIGTGAGVALISYGASASTVGAIAGLSSLISREVTKGEYKDLSPEVIKVANLINDKETTIKNFKTALEDHSDFEADWGLDRWLPAIQGMPGWSKSAWAKAGAENIGYSFTYWISYYAYEYLKIKFGSSIAKAVKETPVQPTPAPVAAQPKPTAAPQTTTPATTSTTTTPSGGVMGASQPKQYNIVVDDSTVANYDL